MTPIRWLPCGRSLKSSYTTRFFLRLAFSDAAALVGFMLDIAMGPWWVYFVGAGFAAVGLSQLSPTRRHLAQDQDELALHGCTRSLTEALRRSTPTVPLIDHLPIEKAEG